MPPYVGLNEKTKWQLHPCISVQTQIFRLVMNFIRHKTLRSAIWPALPHLTEARTLLEIVAKVTNFEM